MPEQARQEASTHGKTGLDQVLENTGLPTVILNQRKHKEALSEAKEMEAVRDGETATLGRTFIRDANEANAFSKLSRYEAAIEHSLYKALDELQRLQAARRAGGGAPAPAAIDVYVSGVSGDGPLGVFVLLVER